MSAPDPYLQWAKLTQLRYLQPMRDAQDGDWLRLITTPEGVAALQERAQHQVLSLVDPAARHRTVWLHADDLPVALDCSNHHRIGLAHPGMAPVGGRKSVGLVDMAPLPEKPGAEEVQPCEAATVIGVIDGRCGFLHQDFWTDEGRTFIRHFWDQGVPATADPAFWRTPDDMQYGRQVTGARLEERFGASLAACATGWQREQRELASYRAIGYALPEAADWSHGTHVLSTALKAYRDLDARGNTSPPVGPALIHVQLPDLALHDTSANWLASHVRDGIDYILARCSPEARVVINLSLGGFGGPQNGTSMLEEAIDERIRRWNGPDGIQRLQVVVAAGNIGTGDVDDDGSGEPRRVHLRKGCKEDGSIEFSWDIEVPDATETFLEFWVPATGDSPVRMTATLIPPPGAVALQATAGPGEHATCDWQDAPGVQAAVFNGTHTSEGACGTGSSLILVALPHTTDWLGRRCGPLGRWSLKLSPQDRAREPLHVDGWIRRRDVPGELAGERPQYGFSKADAPSGQLADQRSTLAHAHQVVVVGAVEPARMPRAIYPFEEADYSSTILGGDPVYGPGRLHGPGFTTGTRQQLRGTSIAAAHVCGALAAQATPSPLNLENLPPGPALPGARAEPSKKVRRVRAILP
ncbi:hypothetical protein [Sphaerotilus mobilis]|uniref:Subtilase family protein n=1 Tax=Sphaerotilus mobilis TaxID=47994 RepID=A0A4Q7LIQ8_9BURK|nr:hypothetical protein [Sphaerotilus mobilis]RZS53398.1 hypothetical protein EV685_3026 [Sphaerotilus mobilis]